MGADFEMKRVRLRPFDRSVKVEDWPNARGIPLLTTLDFPMINNNYNGMKNRYAYGWVSIDYWRQTLVKKDLEDTMNDKMWSQNSHYPGEVFFIPRPGAEAEDDGVLVTVVFDGEKKRSYLLLLDGQTFTEVNRPTFPSRSPSHSMATGSQSFTEQPSAPKTRISLKYHTEYCNQISYLKCPSSCLKYMSD